jgi:hypothetical protein
VESIAPVELGARHPAGRPHRVVPCRGEHRLTAVAEKAGFTFEGRLRRSYRYGDGLEHDELLWSHLSDDPAPQLSIRS